MFVPNVAGWAALVTPQSEMWRARRRRWGTRFEEEEDEAGVSAEVSVEAKLG